VSASTVPQGAASLLTSCHVPYLPLLSCLSLLYMCGLCLCQFSGLVCDLLLSGGQGLSPDCAFKRPEEYLGHNLGEHCLEDTGAVWWLVYPGGHHSTGRYVPLYLGRLGCWNLLAWGCMPVHKHCELFLQRVSLNLGVLEQFVRSYVINLLLTTRARLVQWLSWVFKTQERKKDRQKVTQESQKGKNEGKKVLLG